MQPFRHALEVLEYDRVREVLTSFAASVLGRRLAGELAPIPDVDLLRRLHEETAEMRELLDLERLALSGLSDVSTQMETGASKGRPAEPDFLWKVVDLLRAGLTVRTILTRHADRFPRLRALGEDIEDVPALRERIPEMIDPREGVRDEASEKLAALRLESHELRRMLRARATSILRRPSLRKCFQTDGLTVKNDRYLLPVKAEFRSWMSGPVRDRSHSGSTLYVEPEEIVQDGDLLLTLLDRERDEVLRILWKLTREVREHRIVLRRVEQKLAYVDLTFAKATYMKAFDLVAPEIDTDGRLELREARHPYLMWLARDVRRDPRAPDLDAVRRQVVPLDVRLGGAKPLLIVTGPNTGGKTVAMKTIGLNVLLALSGVPIAAAPASRVPSFNDLFVDIGDEQSLEQSLSTFSSHLRQIVHVLRHATKRSLILLDELGSGTDPLEGAALGTALLDHFRENGWTAILTTHLGSLKEYAYLHDAVENAAMEFDSRSLRPTYRLLMGVPGSSNALAIARRLGVKEEIVAAAEKAVAQEEEPTREIISRMERSKRRVEKEHRRAERMRRRVQGDKREYEERLHEIELRKDSLDREAEVEVDRTVRAARERLRPLVDKLKYVPQTHRPTVDELATAIELLLVATPLGDRREEFARSLRKEDEVYVPKFRSRGKVRKINKGERTVTVLLGAIPTQVSFDDVSWVEGPRE